MTISTPKNPGFVKKFGEKNSFVHNHLMHISLKFLRSFQKMLETFHKHPENFYKTATPESQKTLAAWQHCYTEICEVWWISQKYSPKLTLFSGKVPSKFQSFFFLIPQNFTLFFLFAKYQPYCMPFC